MGSFQPDNISHFSLLTQSIHVSRYEITYKNLEFSIKNEDDNKESF